MRKLIVTEFVSLDGVMEAPGGEAGYAHSGWVGDYFSDELGEYKLAEQLGSDTLLLGRTTYESFYGAWPFREGPMADKLNTMTKYVASTTHSSFEWEGAHHLKAPVESSVANLKNQDGGPILVAGSRSLVHALLGAGLVDQLNLQVFPVVLGSGLRVYPETPSRTNLELISSRTVTNGVQVQQYAVAPAK